MKRKAFLAMAIAILTSTALTSAGLAAEKLRYGFIPQHPVSTAVPALTVEEKGFWKQEGLEVEMVGFRGTHEAISAVAAKQLEMGTIMTVGVVLAASRGAPLTLVASLNQKAWWSLYVQADSPYKKPEDLKGKKLGVTSLHDITGAYGRFLNKALGLNLRLVGAGGSVERFAALQAGAVEATVGGAGGPSARLIFEGKLRELLSITDYAPKPFEEYHIFARNDLMENSPGAVRKTVRGMLKVMNFLAENRPWTAEKIKAKFGIPEALAQLEYDINFKGTGGEGRTDPKVLQNVRDFLVEYDVIAKEKAPQVDQMFTNRFVQ